MDSTSTRYQIRIKGQLDPATTSWIGDLSLSHTPDGDTLLTGSALDQAALHGLLARCRDLGLTLISINRLGTESTQGESRSTIQENHMLTVENAQVFVAEQGQGVPTLFLHGFPDSGDLWKGVTSTLATRYRCIAPDLPGFGRSSAPDNFDISLSGMSRFIDELVDALDIHEPLNLVTIDFGGHFGLAWASQHPDKVRRLAIMNTSFFSDYRWHRTAQMIRTPILGEMVAAMLNPALMKTTLKQGSPTLTPVQLTYSDSLYITPALKRMMLKLYRHTEPRNFIGWEDQMCAMTAKVPTWVLWGDKDPYAASALADRFGAQKVIHYPTYGHWLPLEAPSELAGRLTELFA